MLCRPMGQVNVKDRMKEFLKARIERLHGCVEQFFLLTSSNLHKAVRSDEMMRNFAILVYV
jgi:hypothetical protein